MKFKDILTLRAIWCGYIVMASQTKAKDGRLVNDQGTPYPAEYIATVLSVKVKEVKRMEREFSRGKEPRLRIEPDGTRVIVGWAKYVNAGDK